MAEAHPHDRSGGPPRRGIVGADLAGVEAGTMITLSDAARLMSGHNLIAIGVQADEARRARHQDRTTFIRVVHVPFDMSAAQQVAPDAGELRIDGTPRDLAHAVQRISAVVAASGSVPVTALALHDLAGLGNPAD